MARIRLIALEDLTPALARMAAEAGAHRANPALFQAMGHLTAALAKPFWAFYRAFRFSGLLEPRLKELVRLKIAALNGCTT